MSKTHTVGGGRLRKQRNIAAAAAPASNWGQRGVPKKIREQVLRRDRYRCRLQLPGCVGEATEVDHITNVAALGVSRAQANQPDGLQSACGPCHKVKTQQERTAGIRRHHAERAAAGRRPDEPHPGLL
jgi:5-methylcytosine-specific restriction protein A